MQLRQQFRRILARYTTVFLGEWKLLVYFYNAVATIFELSRTAVGCRRKSDRRRSKNLSHIADKHLQSWCRQGEFRINCTLLNSLAIVPWGGNSVKFYLVRLRFKVQPSLPFYDTIFNRNDIPFKYSKHSLKRTYSFWSVIK